jgi:seryl-tRNA synthetase
MIDIKLLREDISFSEKNLKKRGFHIDVKGFEDLDSLRKKVQKKTEDLQQEKNKLSKDFGLLKKEGKSTDTLSKKIDDIKNQLSDFEKELSDIQFKLSTMLMEIPNLVSDDTPDGKDELANKIIREYSKPKVLKSKSHLELTSEISLELGNKLSGSRFSVLSGSIAKLHRAISAFMIDEAIKAGYREFYVPYIVNYDALEGTGQLPKFEEDLFKLENDQYLIPTAEVPLTNLYREKIVSTNELPLKMTAHTPCFRSEAGSYGRDTNGLIRLHAESLLMKLALPYRVVQICAGDLGFSSYKTYDLEVWMPSQEKYREISSCSNFLDFQARRSKIRYKDGNSSTFLHTLNGSALAVGRTLIAIIENYFDEQLNKILIPECLKSYFGDDQIIL